MPHSRAELAYFLDARDARKALQEIAEMLHDTLPALVEVLGSTEPRAVTIVSEWTTDDQGARGPEFIVWDTANASISSELVGSFLTESEAMACIVGLDYADRAGSKAQRYVIDYPVAHTTDGRAT